MTDDRPLDLLVDVQQALVDPRRLTRNELSRAGRFFRKLNPAEKERYFSELFLLLADDLLSVQSALNNNRSAIQEFDKSSQKLTRWLIGLTVVLVILTVVIAGFTVLLWKRG